MDMRASARNSGSKSERKISPGKLRAIGSPRLRMDVDRVLMQRRGVTRVHSSLLQRFGPIFRFFPLLIKEGGMSRVTWQPSKAH
jgi:hypothetical protein